MALENGQRDVARVAVAVVEGQRGERGAALREPLRRFVQGYEFETARSDER